MRKLKDTTMQQLPARRQTGFSLIEIMITMVVLSIGLLGIAGIIVTNLKNTQSASSRGQATFLINDIVDRMRANRVAAETIPSPYALALGGTGSGVAGVPGTDLRDWVDSLQAALPEGKGSVVVDNATRNITVTVQWNDSRAQGGGVKSGKTAQQLVVETHL